MDFTKLFYIFITALFSSLIIVPVLRQWALEKDELDVPDERKIHSQATPRLGGIAVFVSFLFSLLLYVEINAIVRGLAAGGLVVFMTGLVDDLHGLSAKKKFLGEIVACLIAMSVGDLYLVDLGNLFGLGNITLPFWLAAPFTVFAVVGVINAINLIDGLDGLAGGFSVIALSAFFVLGLHYQNSEAMLLCAALAGAMLGFLKYNFYPARIFMGDTGSLVVGFMLGFLAIHLTQQPGAAAVKPVVPLLILGVPIIDTVWVMIRRIGRKLSPFAPDRTHVHHKFLDLGFEHRYTVIIIYGLTLFWSIFAVFAHRWTDARLFFFFLTSSVLFYCALRCLVRRPELCRNLLQDSPRSLRNSRIYGRLADLADLLSSLTVFPVLGFLILGVVAGEHFPVFIWQILGTLLIMTFGLVLLLRDFGLHYLFFLVYLGLLGLTYSVDRYGQGAEFLGYPLGLLGNAVIAAIAALVGLKIAFRKDGDFFVSSVDILVLGISIFLAAFFYHVHPMPDIALPLVQSFVLYLGLRISLNKNALHARLATCGMLTTLATITLRGLF